MKIKIILIGRSNVGKSSLFNLMTQTNNAIIDKSKNTTIDYKYKLFISLRDFKVQVIDTPGISQITNNTSQIILDNIKQVLNKSHIILFLVNARNNCTHEDEHIATLIRKQNKPIFLLVNKIDKVNIYDIMSDFLSLGFINTYFISVKNKINTTFFNKKVLIPFIENKINSDYFSLVKKRSCNNITQKIIISIIGRPNVGKSTIINNIISSNNRLMTSNQPGTTRDSIEVSYIEKNNKYIFIDTAGIRKRKNIKDLLEKNSIQRSIKSIYKSDLVILVINAADKVLKQDLFLLNQINIMGKLLIILINKWDLISKSKKKTIKQEINEILHFVTYIPKIFVSGRYDKNIFKNIKKTVYQVHESAKKRITSSILTRLLHNMLKKHKPPIINGKKIKLKFAHPEHDNKNIYLKKIIIYGNKTHLLTCNYIKYLSRQFQTELNLIGIPITLIFKNANNPYIID
ncbi:GTPase Der [Buchnera aphidicola (Thelaxes suberi)]|uniref:ribosome biogenesis GTPase Der n=1 Tax=Buchnera aphidicola TaxID=9 RepID=UPI003464702A